jgi:hypothetical protein
MQGAVAVRAHRLESSVRVHDNDDDVDVAAGGDAAAVPPVALAVLRWRVWYKRRPQVQRGACHSGQASSAARRQSTRRREAWCKKARRTAVHTGRTTSWPAARPFVVGCNSNTSLQEAGAIVAAAHVKRERVGKVQVDVVV